MGSCRGGGSVFTLDHPFIPGTSKGQDNLERGTVWKSKRQYNSYTNLVSTYIPQFYLFYYRLLQVPIHESIPNFPFIRAKRIFVWDIREGIISIPLRTLGLVKRLALIRRPRYVKLDPQRQVRLLKK